jgi:hypothetical protein
MTGRNEPKIGRPINVMALRLPIIQSLGGEPEWYELG